MCPRAHPPAITVTDVLTGAVTAAVADKVSVICRKIITMRDDKDLWHEHRTLLKSMSDGLVAPAGDKLIHANESVIKIRVQGGAVNEPCPGQICSCHGDCLRTCVECCFLVHPGSDKSQHFKCAVVGVGAFLRSAANYGGRRPTTT